MPKVVDCAGCGERTRINVNNKSETCSQACRARVKKTRQLLKEREENEEKIDDLESEIWNLTVAICEIEGNCPRCKNWHYPHCWQPL